jgi:hypothetical protein
VYNKSQARTSNNLGKYTVMKDPTDYNVRAVERALQILGCFDNEHPERGLSEIALAVNLHKATAHRIVTTLVNYGYLERADDGQKYRLGLGVNQPGFQGDPPHGFAA